MIFNPTGQTEGKDGAIFIHVYDMAGNWTAGASWGLWIDKTPPTTAMNTLAATQPSNAFLLTWIGSDNLSGIDYVEIQERLAEQNWVTFPPVYGSASQYWIIGDPGNTYSYRMHGVDNSGNSETYPAGAETNTAVPQADVLCSAPDSYDTSGNDNSPVNASIIYANGAPQIHNFCNPLSPNYQNDEDWIELLVANQQHYLIKSVAGSLPTATIISLYAQDGGTLLAESIPANFGDDTFLVWTSDRDEIVYLRLSHLDGRVIGNDVGSTMSVTTGDWSYLPLLHR
jgi:hypothetical protein